MDYRLCTVNIQRLLLLSVFSCCCIAKDLIELDVPVVNNGATLVSAGTGMFTLGFFTPSGSSSENKYVGIWYTSSPQTVVWVANREKPVPSTSHGVFRISNDGDLQVWDESKEERLWSTEIKTSQANLTAKLMDSGNLVLGDSLWESFKNPTDTFLPGMKMETNMELTSWKKRDDPAPGSFSFKIDDEGRAVEYNIFVNKSTTYWKSGGKLASSNAMPDVILNMLSNYSRTFKLPVTRPNNASRTSLPSSRSVDYRGKRLVLMFNGSIAYQKSKEGKMISMWNEPENKCSVNKACGDFGSCNTNSAQLCRCLPGFKPTYPLSWDSGDFVGGCRRIGGEQYGNTFLNLTMMNVGKPDLPDTHVNETVCRKDCLNSQVCTAYSFQTPEESVSRKASIPNNTCSIWEDSLKNLQEDYIGGRNLSIRVSTSDLEVEDHQPSEALPRVKSKAFPFVIVLTSITVVALLGASICFIIWRRRNMKKQEKKRSDHRSKDLLKLDTQNRIKHYMNSGEFEEEGEDGMDVPFFDFDAIIAATDDFSDYNKLGQGGYGPVYKGTFQGGQEIAVKRLSSVSGQGLEEFKNEVVLIAKLQHRNLVRLRGYCIQGGEKILLYEYMPNRSLDSFIFDQEQSKMLDWETRFNIILGVARGLLYLHQDSRLRIIHRDLKTSNILLDQEMEPKISDFGLARIFGGKQTEANTERVVGTYGYMSPEYALEGLFSVKSDVFSFGVVLLEILSGKRNTRVVRLSGRPLSLLGYAWQVWTENQVSELVDPAMTESCNSEQFLKCVKIALLCVQEDPSERPTMSTVVTMLDSDSANVPDPLQPAFVLKSGANFASTSSASDTRAEITVTLEQGR